MNEKTHEAVQEVAYNLKDFLERHNNSYFLTITLKPKLYKFTSVTQLELTNHDVYAILYRNSVDYIVVAEHTQAGNIHYHAVVAFSGKLQRIQLLNMFKKNRALGFVKLDPEPVSNKVATANYMTKELYENYRILTAVRGHNPRIWMTSNMWRLLVDN